MLLIEYVGHKGLRSLTGGHLGRHLEYFKTLNDARVASVGFIEYNASTTRINKEKNFKIKFRVILVFHRTKQLGRLENEQSPVDRQVTSLLGSSDVIILYRISAYSGTSKSLFEI